jgi:hypothetical protein
MSTLQFDRGPEKLSLIMQDGSTLARFDAANNVDSRSKGIWPDGLYQFSFYNAHPGDLPNSAYGSHGIFVLMCRTERVWVFIPGERVCLTALVRKALSIARWAAFGRPMTRWHNSFAPTR